MPAALDDQRLRTSSGTCGALGELDVPINRSLRNFYSVREADKPDPLVLQSATTNVLDSAWMRVLWSARLRALLVQRVLPSSPSITRMSV